MAAAGNGLAAVLYAPSKVTARAGNGANVTITEETGYPFAGTIYFPKATDDGAFVDYSNKQTLRFLLRGDGRQYTVMFLVGKGGGIPPMYSVDAGPECKLRLERGPDLAPQNQVERGIERGDVVGINIQETKNLRLRKKILDETKRKRSEKSRVIKILAE